MITIFSDENSVISKRMMRAITEVTNNYRLEYDMDKLFTWFREADAGGVLLFHAVTKKSLEQFRLGFKNAWDFRLIIIIPSNDRPVERYAQQFYPRIILKENDNFEILTGMIRKIYQKIDEETIL